MRKYISLLFATIALAVSCEQYDHTPIWDKLNDHEQRIQTLEELCGQLNTNIESLKSIITALQANDYITNVVAIVEGGKEIGYTFYFSKSDPVTVYHGKDGSDGKDGQDGADGKDGQTPVIGIKKDGDGVYYWTLNGEWLLDDNGEKVPASGKDGQDGAPGAPGQDGTDGTPGAPGAPGADGKDGVTPQIKIEEGYWYVSYDNGLKWTRLGKATGEDGKDGVDGAPGQDGAAGAPGQDGQDGDSMFRDIEITSDYVFITLADGTQFKIPTWKAFEELQDKVDQANSNIAALQAIVAALQNNDYVTSVVSVYEKGQVIGYTITFSKSGIVTIYHGKDGADGADGKPGADGSDGEDGKDGQTPVIGIKKDVDGVYYWTLNGEWLLDDNGEKVPASGKDGQDGAPGAPGQDGTDGAPGQDGTDGTPGAPGADGKDGVTPQLKIEEGYWYVSYDNGKTWTKLGKATGEDGKDGVDGAPGQDGAAGAPGQDGQDGQDGDSFFKGVDTSNSDYVIITLADGTQIKIPTWKAFEELKELVNRINGNVASLQAIVEALQNNDYVKSVTPIYELGEIVGYTITFAKSGPVAIYNGKDGYTPTIGVKKDTDGNYYWTLDGEWMKDSEGNKIPTTAPGADGQPGAPGQDGEDGITPLLKIEDDYWFVSYDNGKTWTKLGKATGEDGKDGVDGAPGQDGAEGAPGQDGQDGQDGDSFFQNVDTANSDYVILTLADGTQIKLPTWAAFEELQAMCGQMNSNITALQTIVNALQNNDYILDIEPIYEDGEEIGYVITFSKSGKVTIYHGKDGADGAPGQDGAPGAPGANGTTPLIGVAKDTDGYYYWTLDGEWLFDSDGNKVRASGIDGTNGSNGSNGANGTDGTDGITPEFKIENGYWYVSYGEGWIQLGKATGPQGPQGPQGDNIFSDFFYDSTTVTFVLWNGTEICVPLNSNGVSVWCSNIGEFSATFAGEVINKSVDFKVTVYYGTSSGLTLYNYAGSSSVTSTSGNTFSLVVDKLYSQTTYFYFIETINGGKTTYTAVSSFRTKTVTGYDSSFDITGAIDLSTAGSANSYIVSQTGTYSIPAVKGNSSTSVGTVSTVDVLWETYGTSTTPTRGNLVKGAKYADGKVYFKTGDSFREGNALIAAKNSSGTILWSWHIWLTDQPKGQVYFNGAGTMMDRNLGATSATPGDVGALGLLYQWGRKDPFLGSSSISSCVVAKSTITFPAVQNSTSTTGTVDYVTKNPTTMLRGATTNNWMYVVDKTLWASEKTIYDPCPAGWRIPEAGENGVWVTAAGRHQIYTNPFDKVNKGVNLSGYMGADDCIWYPATGYYGKADGNFYGVGSNASYHSVSLGDTYGTLCFTINQSSSDLYLLYVTDFGGAEPARCIKDQSAATTENVNNSQGAW